MEAGSGAERCKMGELFFKKNHLVLLCGCSLGVWGWCFFVWYGAVKGERVVVLAGINDLERIYWGWFSRIIEKMFTFESNCNCTRKNARWTWKH
jgi:hypothetical protein